ncbi:hypothetical protein [Arenimonas alkanexedens]
MNFLLAAPCLIVSVLVICLMYAWHPPKVQLHDLTRSGDFLDQIDRTHNNDLSIAHYEARRDALGLGACREVRSV